MYLDKTEYQTSIDLGLYIEGLLNTDYEEVEIKTDAEEKLESILLNDLMVSEAEEGDTNVEKEVIVEQEHQEKANSNIPLWGQEPFKCLTVKTAGKSLMIPALSVSFIERINKKIIRLPLETESFRGVVTLRGRSVAIIDLYKLISENSLIPEQGLNNIEEQHVEHVIVMEDSSCALVCDDIGEIVELYPEQVRWNKASFNNPMFSGIVPDHLCAIVNIECVQNQIAAMPFVQSLNSNYTVK